MAFAEGVLFSQLHDSKVRSLGRVLVGQIHEMLFDPETGEIQYVILRYGGFLGVAEKLAAVPWSVCAVETGPMVTVNFDQQRLRTGPSLSGPESYAKVAGPDYARALDKHYMRTGDLVPETEAIGGAEDLESEVPDFAPVPSPGPSKP